jgi:AcrR family transcriptional regulator
MRPEPAGTDRPGRSGPSGRAGRPALRSRAGITAAAIGVADREGLDAVSMRRVAAELGTGAASLYRYVETRDELLDLMCDATAAEYTWAEPAGDWLAGLLAVGEQQRGIMRRHPWLPGLILTRPVLGPHGLALLEHVLEVLAPHPASVGAKLEAFAMLTSITATFAQEELSGDSARQERNAAFLQHALASGQHPQLARRLAEAAPLPAEVADRYRDVLGRILTGLLS